MMILDRLKFRRSLFIFCLSISCLLIGRSVQATGALSCVDLFAGQTEYQGAKRRYLEAEIFQPFLSLAQAKKFAKFFQIHFTGELLLLSDVKQLEYLNFVLLDASKIPPLVVKIVTRLGGRIDLTVANVTNHPFKDHLKGKVVEKWRNGKTYDECSGIACGLISIVAIDSSGNEINFGSSGSRNLLLHEFGHTFDRAMQGQHGRRLSSLSQFNLARTKSRWNDFYYDDNPEEAFAEAFAKFLKGAESKKLLKLEHPDLFGYFESLLLGKMKLHEDNIDLRSYAVRLENPLEALYIQAGRSNLVTPEHFNNLIFVKPEVAKKLLSMMGQFKPLLTLQVEKSISDTPLVIGKLSELDNLEIQITKPADHDEKSNQYRYKYSWNQIESIGFPIELVNPLLLRLEQMHSRDPLVALSARTNKAFQAPPNFFNNIVWIKPKDAQKYLKASKLFGFLIAVQRKHPTENGSQYDVGQYGYSDENGLATFVLANEKATSRMEQNFEWSEVQSIGLPKFMFEGLWLEGKSLSEKSPEALLRVIDVGSPITRDHLNAMVREDIKAKLEFNYLEFKTGDLIMMDLTDAKTGQRVTKTGFIISFDYDYNLGVRTEVQVHFVGEMISSKFEIGPESVIHSAYKLRRVNPWTSFNYYPAIRQQEIINKIDSLINEKLKQGKAVYCYFEFNTDFRDIRTKKFLTGQIVGIEKLAAQPYKMPSYTLLVKDANGVVHKVDLNLLAEFRLHITDSLQQGKVLPLINQGQIEILEPAKRN